MRILLTSPHYDDAILSMGEFMQGKDCTVITVFGGVPDIELTPYDEKTGFGSSKEAVESRRLEDKNALNVLEVKQLWLDHLDEQYHMPSKTEDIIHDLLDIIPDYDMVLAPLGMLHPDHIQVNKAIRIIANSIDKPFYLWADLPARKLLLGEAWKLAQGLQEISLSSVDKELKWQAFEQYKSQVGGDLSRENILIGEQLWKLR